ncbi:MAG: tetratricopeptide repeat protein [Chloroflexia bacterium]|nr:tetratricopeptide repeat protein [Chloroflexia bacterium]
MTKGEHVQLVVLDLDTFSGSERFMQATRAGEAFSKGLRAYLNTDYAQAAEEFRLALIAAYVEGDSTAAEVTDRDRAIIYLYVGNSLAFQHDWKAALREYLNAVQTDATLAEAHYNIGVSFAAQSQIEKAINAFKETLRYNSDLYEAKFALGRCHQAMDNPGAAYIFFTAAHDCRPDAAEPIYYIGLMHQAHGAHELAQKCFAEALRVEPTFQMDHAAPESLETRSEQEAVLWYYRLGDDLKNQGYPEEAERIYQALLQWKPEEHRARYLLANLLARQKNWKGALAEYQQITSEAREYVPASVKMSHIFRLLKRPKVSYQILYRCAQQCPEEAAVFQELGKVLATLGRLPAALKCLQRAVQLDAQNAQTYYLLGRLYMAQGNENKALSAWKRALQISPQLVSLRYDMGVIHLKRGRYRQATQEFQSVLQHWPDDTETHYLLGLSFKEAGDPAQAIDYFERVVQANPQHAQALYYLGACHLQLGNSTAGMAYLQQYDRLLRATTSVLGY